MLIQSDRLFAAVIASLCLSGGFAGAESAPLHQRIDALVANSAGEAVQPSRSTDWEFLRRVYLDFSGEIPPAETVRKFSEDPDPAKRVKMLDHLLADDRYAVHMADQFNILLMERRGENAHWRTWLESSFSTNKPWDQMASEMIRADQRDEGKRGAAFFYSKRLEKYGQNPTDYAGLTRDVGRLFLGINLQCAECHNHLTIDHYKQADFQGLHVAYQNLKLYGGDYPAIEEGILEGAHEYASVFTGKKRSTGPRIPGLEEITIKTFEKTDAYELPPDRKAKLAGVPKFSALSLFAEQLPKSQTFSTNIANRLWFLMIGRGIVEPLDLHHPKNPPSDPALLELLSSAFKASGYNIQSFLREIALTETYQRSGILATGTDTEMLAVERRLSAEQLHRIFLGATSTTEASLGEEAAKELKKKFLEAFANEPVHAELEFSASLKGTLLLLNDQEIATILAPTGGNLAARLIATKDDGEVCEELFLNIFSRPPTDEEREETLAYLKRDPAVRADSISDLIWAMLSSTEFATNH